jgi:hypothetical protein
VTELQRTIRDLYLAGVKCKDIAEKVNVSEKNIYKRVSSMRKKGLITVKRKEMKITVVSKGCEFTPGKACFSCPYPDCIAGVKKGMSGEEKTMLSDGMTVTRTSKCKETEEI